MTIKARRKNQGSSLLDFTLVGIPLICILIATFELSRGMWSYQSLAYAVKSGVRYSIVHGQSCSQAPSACSVTISQIADTIRTAGIGLPADLVTLTFTDGNGGVTTCLLSDCIASYTSTTWPPLSASAPGRDVQIAGSFEFHSAMVMFWPGAGRPVGPPGVINLSAASRESIQY